MRDTLCAVTRWTTAALAFLAAACEAGSSAESARPAPPTAECRASADRVRDAFERPEGAVLFRGVGPAPPASRGRALDARLPRIVVTEDRVAIDDIDITGPAPPSALAGELAMRASLAAGGSDHARGDGHAGGWANAALLYAPGATPVARLRDALAEIDPELRFDLVVQDASSGALEEPSPPPWLDAELTELRSEPELEVRRQRFRVLLTRAVGTCAALQAHVPFAFGRDPSVPATAAPDGTLADAMLACRCEGVEVDAVVAIGILTGPPNRRPLRALSFRRATEPGDGVITAIPTGSVSGLVVHLAEANDPLRVYFAPDGA